jgi:hypothetical protein
VALGCSIMALTNADRQRRFRERRRSTVTSVTQSPVTAVTPPVTPLTTAAIAELAGRVSAGRASPADLELAGRLLLMLIRTRTARAVINPGDG